MHGVDEGAQGELQEAKDNNKKSGDALATCPFYNELDGVLSNLVGMEPSYSMDTSVDPGPARCQNLDICKDFTNPAPDSQQAKGEQRRWTSPWR